MPTFISNKNISAPEPSASIPSRSLSLPLFFPKNFFETSVSDQARADFFDHLATLLASGITLVNALDFIRDSVSHPKLKAAIERIQEAIRGGDSFSSALSREPEIFDRVVIGMVKAAESTGRIGVISLELAVAFTRRA